MGFSKNSNIHSIKHFKCFVLIFFSLFQTKIDRVALLRKLKPGIDWKRLGPMALKAFPAHGTAPNPLMAFHSV
jgi:hypothetical protein